MSQHPEHPDFDDLVHLLCTHFTIDRADIAPQITFSELGLDSLALMELLVVAESELGVVLVDSDVELGRDITLGEAVHLLERLPADTWPAAGAGPAPH